MSTVESATEWWMLKEQTLLEARKLKVALLAVQGSYREVDDWLFSVRTIKELIESDQESNLDQVAILLRVVRDKAERLGIPLS